MSRRINVILQEETHEKLKKKSEQAGCTISNLIRAWLCNCEKVQELTVHRSTVNPGKVVSYNIFLEEGLIKTLDEIAKELGVPRNTLISNTIEAYLGSSKDSFTLINTSYRSSQENYNWLEEDFSNLPLEEALKKILNSGPFLNGEMSGGILMKRGRFLETIGITDFYFKKGVQRFLPINRSLIRFDIYNHHNLFTAAIHTNNTQVTTHLRDILHPLLTPFVWNRIQRFVGAKLITVFPLSYNGVVCGAFCISFHTVKLDLKTMSLLEKYTKRVGEIVGEKTQEK